MLRALASIRRRDAVQCGNKAACLGELTALGYAVPAGVVLPTAAYESFLTHSGLGTFVARQAADSVSASPARLLEIEREVATAFAAAGLDPRIEAELQGWMQGRPTDTFAVRSSATQEDLRGASFAGQYSSWLSVRDADVPQAVLRCFASLFTARVALYRRRRSVAGVGAMSVIVQEMLGSEHAGVVFTQAPRRRGRLLIECAPGLGEGVVSGTVAPNRYYLDRATLDIEDACERHAIDTHAVRAVARQALSIEAHLGGPQDIEYGVVARGVYILQARPASV